MKDILVVATNRTQIHSIRKSIDDDCINRVRILHCKLITDIIKHVDDILSSNVEVIVTTPGISLCISHLVNDKIPVLQIEYNNIDIVQSLQTALSLNPHNVALGHYLQENPRLSDIKKIIAQEFSNFIFGNDDKKNIETLKRLKAKGITTIVGGGYICNIARDIGFIVFKVLLNTVTINDILHKALSIANSKKNERHSQTRLNILLNNQSEAVIAINQKNEITFFSKGAEKVMSIHSTHAIGHKSSKIFPGNKFEQVLKSKKEIENHVCTINDIDIVGNYIPVFDNYDIIGAVCTLSTSQDIQNKNASIRKFHYPPKYQAKYHFEDFYNDSPAFKKLLEKAQLFAKTDETILITGESGTGKEVMAGSIHNASRRRSKPFIAVNCAAIPPTLIESELFGYEPGAFTGSKKNGSQGMFEFAHGGTLFLDEIGEMPFEMQSKLLRAIQEKEIRRIGSSVTIPVDVRIVAATNRDMLQEILNNNFRKDLYYRLNVLQLTMPSLCHSSEYLTEISLKIAKKLYPDTNHASLDRLKQLLVEAKNYTWPGNYRELENIIRRYMTLNSCSTEKIKLSDIFDFDQQFYAEETDANTSLNDKKTCELKNIMETYHKMQFNKTLTAKTLGISRSTLWRKLKG